MKQFFKKQIIVLAGILFSCMPLHSQTDEELAYSLVSHTIDTIYSSLYHSFDRNRMEDSPMYGDTLLYLYIDSETYPDYVFNNWGRYAQELRRFILKGTGLDEYKAARGIGMDTLRWGSIYRQTENLSIPFKTWDCNLFTNKEVVCLMNFEEKRNEFKEETRITRYTNNRREESKYPPHRYGLYIGYPVFFEYEGIIYGFNSVYFMYLDYTNSIVDHVEMFFSKWNGVLWETVYAGKIHDVLSTNYFKYLRHKNDTTSCRK